MPVRMAGCSWQAFNRTAAAWLRQLGMVLGEGVQARVIRLHDVAPAPGRTTAAHAHAWFELSVVLGGSIAYSHGGTERVVAPGGTFAMPPGSRHGWRAAGGRPVITGYQLAITPVAGRAAIDAWYGRLAADGWTLPPHPLPAALAGELHRCGGDALLAAQLVRAHLLWSFAALGAPGTAPAPAEADADPVPALREHILEHLAEDLRLVDLARRLGISPRHLNRRFARLTGRPLRRFVIEQRLDQAAQSLLWRDEPVAAVARSVGYADPGYFGRLFRARFGSSPERWRSEARRRDGR